MAASLLTILFLPIDDLLKKRRNHRFYGLKIPDEYFFL